MALHLVIRGIVQGVGYRESLCREADRLGIKGWVRNRIDGSVEAVVDGDAAALQTIVEWARRGPPAARVSHLHSESCEALESSHLGFQRRPTQ
ncbi:MAG TPA: acylphosphatase [Burkholderiales bacterium]|nr:acylphosphatase [Burkholderiales bacterium]